MIWKNESSKTGDRKIMSKRAAQRRACLFDGINDSLGEEGIAKAVRG